VLVLSLVVLSLTQQSFSEYQPERPREPIPKAAADQSMRVGQVGPNADPLNDGCQIVNGDAMWLRDDEAALSVYGILTQLETAGVAKLPTIRCRLSRVRGTFQYHSRGDPYSSSEVEFELSQSVSQSAVIKRSPARAGRAR
jgi:hypothetical protein